MNISDLLRMCLRNLFRRKVRTLLTVTGVVIGTCSIVVMISLGVGLNKTSEESMSQYMDLTSIEVYTQEGGGGAPGGATSSKPQSSALDDRALKTFATMENVEVVTPVISLQGNFLLRTGPYTYQGEIVAMDIGTLEQFGYEAEEGYLPTSEDDKYTVLFGAEAAREFVNEATGEYSDFTMDDEGNFVNPPLVDVLNESITIAPIDQGGGNSVKTGDLIVTDTDFSAEEVKTGKEHDISVSGISKSDYSKPGAAYGVVISLELAEQLIKEYNELNTGPSIELAYSSARVKVNDMANVEIVEDLIKAEGFGTYSATEFREAMQQEARIIQLVLGGLGAIAMLVAALGITNTMIMSIYERTREIGVMKVLGCRLRDIRTMFLMEAGGIGFLGGTLGIIISYIISIVLNLVLSSMIDMGTEGSVQLSVIPFWLVLLGMSFAVGVGLVAGFYPANRAVRISALSAIRQE